MSTFSHDALRVIGLSRVIACGALYLESRELHGICILVTIEIQMFKYLDSPSQELDNLLAMLLIGLSR